MKFLKLYNGIEIPVIGYGEFLVNSNDCIDNTIVAINNGYLHIDTAQIYGNEIEVGKAINFSKIDRNKLFITTKVWVTSMGYEKAKKSIYESLKKMNLEYLDLVLIHQPYGDYYGAWRALEELYDEQKIRAIGVSNFTLERLADLTWHSRIKPMVNQIEISPLIFPTKMIDFCAKNNIVLEAWSPLGGQARKELLLNDKNLLKIAKKKNKSIPQIILRWLIQQNIVVLVKSSNASRIKENIDIFDFELTDEEIKIINEMNKNAPLIEHSSLEGLELIKDIVEKNK